MQKVTMLLPIAYNDGNPIPEVDTQRILKQIADIAGGYTIDGIVKGSYRMDNGVVVTEELQKIFVVVGEDKVCFLRDVAEYACGIFKQESIYFERQHTAVDFVRQ